MKKLFAISLALFATLSMSACVSNPSAEKGPNCDFSKEKPYVDMPQNCFGRD